MKHEHFPHDLFLETEEEPHYVENMQGQSMIIQAKIYEKQPEPFSQRLRRATWLGILLTLVTAVIVYSCLPTINSVISRTFFPFWIQGLNQALSQYLIWLQSQAKWVSYIDGVLLGSGGVLLVTTRNLRRGNAGQYALAFTQIIGGVGNVLLLLIPIIMYLPNILLWLLVFLVTVALVVLTFFLVRAIFS